MKMKNSFSALFAIAVLLSACQDAPKSNGIEQSDLQAAEQTDGTSSPEMAFQNKAHELVYKLTQTVGDLAKLRAKKDVTYTYTYTTVDQKTDKVDEKYIFDGEYSYGAYQQHERTTPQLTGLIEQGFDGKSVWLRHAGAYVEDEALLKQVLFNRKTNFYWFTMFQKLMDPGLNYAMVKVDVLDGKNYDVVDVSFNSEDGKPTDIYRLWINKETSLVDQFLFTVADFGKMEVPNLMKLQYEEVDGLLLPTKRMYTKADWEGKIIKDEWIHVEWSNIKFNTGISKDIFFKN